MELQIKNFNIGKREKTDPIYRKLRKIGQLRTAYSQNLSSRMANDNNFKRMKYVRYADDFIIGVIGSKQDCIQIRENLSKFLSEQLNLNLNLDKTKVTHASIEIALFLGTNIRTTPQDKKPYRRVIRGAQSYLMRSNTSVQLLVPIRRLVNKLTEKNLCRDGGKPTRWSRIIPFDKVQIVNHMWQIWSGISNYYSFADNYRTLANSLYFEILLYAYISF